MRVTSMGIHFSSKQAFTPPEQVISSLYNNSTLSPADEASKIKYLLSIVNKLDDGQHWLYLLPYMDDTVMAFNSTRPVGWDAVSNDRGFIILDQQGNIFSATTRVTNGEQGYNSSNLSPTQIRAVASRAHHLYLQTIQRGNISR
jgi:hypothetical protein